MIGKQNMNIAILTSGILPIPAVMGGAVENLIDFYLEYNDQHRLHNITVYSINHPALKKSFQHESEVNRYHYINVTSFWARFKRRLYFYKMKNEPYDHFIGYYLEQSLKHISKCKYDIIILENRPNYVLKVKEKTKSKIIYHLHNDMLNNETPNHQIIYNAAYKIICVSNYIKNRVRTINPNDTKCITVYNGIDLEAFSIKKPITIHREDIGFNEKDFIVVYNGRINKEKGVSELLDAMLKLKEYPQIKLLIIGSSFFGNINTDDDYINSLINKSQKIRNRIKFTGFIPYNKVPSYLHLANIAVLPSMWEEPFGLTILESMAAGVPLITTRSGGIPEICENCAILIERENIVQHISESIESIFMNPEIAKLLSKKAYKRSLKFNKTIFSRAFLTQISETITNKYNYAE